MGRYFGHKPAWARAKPSPYAIPEGGPLRPNPNPYNKAGNQMIIPPNRGQFPRGSSLPGMTPRSGGALAAAQRAARSALALRGLLGPLNMLSLLADFETWYNSEPTPIAPYFSPGAGWSRCANPNAACTSTWAPETHWRWSAATPGNPNCSAFGSCPVNQAIGDAVAPGTTVPSGMRELWRLRITNVPLNRFTVFERWKRTVDTSSQPNWRRAAMLAPDTSHPPAPMVKEKDYPQNSTSPKNRPYLKPYEVPAHYWGPTLPPKGVDHPHPLVPPGRRTREEKWWVSGGKWGRAAGTLTEFKDFADCLASSIPGNPCAGMKLGQKVACILANEAKIDMPAAITCFMEEQGRDAAFRVKSIAGKPRDNPYYSRPVGPSTGFGWNPRVPSMTPL